jgi:hypothetical protein
LDGWVPEKRMVNGKDRSKGVPMKNKQALPVANPAEGVASSQGEESVFFQEWLAAGQPPEQLSISSVCNARCLFCSNRMNPFPLREGVFRDIEDVKLQLSLVSTNHTGGIHMSDSLPGRISEGEAFLHPQFFDILSLVREKFLTNVLHFTTNASLLDEPFVRKLVSFRPLEINISLHSTQPGLWARIFGSTEKRARIALNAMGLLKRYHIDFTGTIVPLPRICGWDDLEETFGFLAAQGAKSVILWWPGFSDKTPPALQKEIECPWKEFQDFARRMQGKYPGVPAIPQPDLTEPRKVPVRRIMQGTLQGNLKTQGGMYREVLWLVSEAAYPEISGLVDRFAKGVENEHRVFPVKNRSYGGNIQVSGLLMVSDFLAAGKEALARYPTTDLVLVPKPPFDAFFRDLQKTPAFQIQESLGRTVWLVFENGTCQPLKGRGFVKPDRDVKGIFARLLKRFDQSLREQRWDVASSWVASYPVQTSDGLLNKAAFRDFLMRLPTRPAPEPPFARRALERLDDRRILCIEDWPAENPSNIFSRWIFFSKVGSDWKMEMFFVSSHPERDKSH